MCMFFFTLTFFLFQVFCPMTWLSVLFQGACLERLGHDNYVLNWGILETVWTCWDFLLYSAPVVCFIEYLCGNQNPLYPSLFLPRSSTNFIGDYFIASPSLCLSFLSYSSTPFLLELGLLFSSLLFWFLWSLFSFFCTYASFFVAGRKYFLFPWHYTLFTRNMWWFYYPNVTLSIYVILNIEKGTQGSENFIIHENTLS